MAYRHVGWKHNIKCQDFWNNDAIPNGDKLRELAKRLKVEFPDWETGDDFELFDVIQELESAPNDDDDEVNNILDIMYDWADSRRVWIGTI